MQRVVTASGRIYREDRCLVGMKVDGLVRARLEGVSQHLEPGNPRVFICPKHAGNMRQHIPHPNYDGQRGSTGANSTEYMMQGQDVCQWGTSAVTVTTPLGLPCVLDLEERKSGCSGVGMMRNRSDRPRHVLSPQNLR